MKKVAVLFVAFALMAPAFAADMHSETLTGTAGALMKAGGTAADPASITKKKYLFIYFSAHWCPPCRAFTPKLVDFYNQNSKNADFELLFVSSDKDQKAMDGYMTETKMPWVGLQLKNSQGPSLKQKYGVKGIPCLVLLDEKEQLLASSYDGGQYKGPQVALEKYTELHKK